VVLFFFLFFEFLGFFFWRGCAFGLCGVGGWVFFFFFFCSFFFLFGWWFLGCLFFFLLNAALRADRLYAVVPSFIFLGSSKSTGPDLRPFLG